MNDNHYTTSDKSCPSQLAWLAFCYAAGELPESQAAEFEQRLADDQAAREALAAAVELSQIVAAAQSTSPARELASPAAARHSSWNARGTWISIGGLAAALLIALLSGVVGPSRQASQEATRRAAQQQLAFAWSETHSELTHGIETGLWHDVSGISFDSDEDLLADGPPPAGEDDETPSWLTVAVLLAHDRAANGASAATTNERLEN